MSGDLMADGWTLSAQFDGELLLLRLLSHSHDVAVRADAGLASL